MISPEEATLYFYLLLSAFFLICNKKIAEWNYKFITIYTKVFHMRDKYLFRVDGKNKENVFLMTRSFMIFFGSFMTIFILFKLFFGVQ